MPWGLIVTGLVGALGWAFGLWQLARAGSFQKDVTAQKLRADAAEAQLKVTLDAEKMDSARYETLVLQLKSEISNLEGQLSANLDINAVRARLERLLSHTAGNDPTTPTGVPSRKST